MIAPDGNTWIELVEGPLPAPEITDWATRPSCGAVVTFAGTARDHSPGRDGVVALAYEAYETAAIARLEEVAVELRRRWPDVEAVALVHRTGEVPIGEAAVVVAVSAPHRDAAFEAARFGIDALKRSVPIWKRERWSGGEAWGLDAQAVVEPAEVGAAGNPAAGTVP